MAADTEETRPPFPPFDEASATQKVCAAEDAWNTKDPEKVSLAYTLESRWRNRGEFITGREEIVAFLSRKWQRELDYRLIKELWTYCKSRLSVRFVYEWHDAEWNWFRSHGNENWEFSGNGLMRRRVASINDQRIDEEGRLFRWSSGPRPEGHPGLTELGL